MPKLSITEITLDRILRFLDNVPYNTRTGVHVKLNIKTPKKLRFKSGNQVHQIERPDGADVFWIPIGPVYEKDYDKPWAMVIFVKYTTPNGEKVSKPYAYHKKCAAKAVEDLEERLWATASRRSGVTFESNYY